MGEKTYLLAVALALFIALPVQADQVCFSYAESYYEQVYCEVKAAGKGRDLPGFYDFRRNDEMMQALLLKRFARRIDIDLKLPKKTKVKAANNKVAAKRPESDDLTARCDRSGNSIRCAQLTYHLVGNRTNQQLPPGILERSNKMGLPVFNGALTDTQAVDDYLVASYQQYLSKMLDIGLGGATLSYGKFAYLFADLNSKGLNFNERFELMYGYLKKDKQIMSVPAKATAPKKLSLADCYQLSQLLVCSYGKNNWIFSRQ